MPAINENLNWFHFGVFFYRKLLLLLLIWISIFFLAISSSISHYSVSSSHSFPCLNFRLWICSKFRRFVLSIVRGFFFFSLSFYNFNLLSHTLRIWSSFYGREYISIWLVFTASFSLSVFRFDVFMQCCSRSKQISRLHFFFPPSQTNFQAKRQCNTILRIETVIIESLPSVLKLSRAGTMQFWCWLGILFFLLLFIFSSNSLSSRVVDFH